MTVDMNVIIGGFVSVIVAIFGSAGFWQWVSNNSNKEVKNEIKKVQTEFAELKEAEEKKEVRNSRRRILRFNDEIINKVKHSKEYFDDVLDDVKIYTDYCEQHKDFANGKTVMAKKNIEHCYEQCMEKHSFLN